MAWFNARLFYISNVGSKWLPWKKSHNSRPRCCYRNFLRTPFEQPINRRQTRFTTTRKTNGVSDFFPPLQFPGICHFVCECRGEKVLMLGVLLPKNAFFINRNFLLPVAYFLFITKNQWWNENGKNLNSSNLFVVVFEHWNHRLIVIMIRIWNYITIP